jgi:hypothetical protein
MFWDSVISGLKVLLYWETYVAGIEYLAIFMGPMIIGGLVMEKNEGLGIGLGCLGSLVLPVFQVAALSVFILTLSPIILGVAEDAAWSFPWKIITLAPKVFFKLVGVLVIASIGLAFIPLLGHLQSLQSLILGGLALTFVIRLAGSFYPRVVTERIEFIPDFWFVVGLLVIGGLLSKVGLMVSVFLATILEDKFDLREEINELLLFPTAAIFGFIPVFIYGAWLGAQIKGGF